MKKIHSIIDFQSNYRSFEMIATLQAICYHLVELLKPPEIRQIRTPRQNALRTRCIFTSCLCFPIENYWQE